MDETMPDASPLSQRFLASLANFMENEHELLGEGDISSKVKVAISESKTTPEQVSTPSDKNPQENPASN